MDTFYVKWQCVQMTWISHSHVVNAALYSLPIFKEVINCAFICVHENNDDLKPALLVLPCLDDRQDNTVQD